MNTKGISREAVIGLNIELSTQELIALKDKCEMINTEIRLATKGRSERKRSILVKTGDIQDLMVFIGKLTGDVLSTTECNAGLFETEDTIAEYNEQALREEV